MNSVKQVSTSSKTDCGSMKVFLQRRTAKRNRGKERKTFKEA